jgi:hypothetical protein
MGIGNCDNSKALLLRKVEVAINVALRVNDDGLPGALAGNQVCILGESVVSDLFKKHGIGLVWNSG